MRALSTVTRVLTNAAGNKVTGVEYYDDKKEKQVQEASVVVLAAWAAQNPRLMLNSATDKHPKGLANGSGLLGKYMMAHFASGTFALFDEDIENHMGTIGGQYFSYDRYDKTTHKDKGAFGSTFIVAGTALKTSDLGGFANARFDLFGPALADFMKRAKRGITRITAFGEEMPNIENRIELASDKDEFGMPLGKIIHSFDQDAVALWNANFEEGLTIAKATGAKEVLVGARQPADHPSVRRHHHGQRRRRLGHRQLRADARDRQSVGRRPRPVPDRRRVEPDLHDLCAVAARRRATWRRSGRPSRGSRRHCGRPSRPAWSRRRNPGPSLRSFGAARLHPVTALIASPRLDVGHELHRIAVVDRVLIGLAELLVVRGRRRPLAPSRYG